MASTSPGKAGGACFANHTLLVLRIERPSRRQQTPRQVVGLGINPTDRIFEAMAPKFSRFLNQRAEKCPAHFPILIRRYTNEGIALRWASKAIWIDEPVMPLEVAVPNPSLTSLSISHYYAVSPLGPRKSCPPQRNRSVLAVEQSLWKAT